MLCCRAFIASFQPFFVFCYFAFLKKIVFICHNFLPVKFSNLQVDFHQYWHNFTYKWVVQNFYYL